MMYHILFYRGKQNPFTYFGHKYPNGLKKLAPPKLITAALGHNYHAHFKLISLLHLREFEELQYFDRDNCV